MPKRIRLVAAAFASVLLSGFQANAETAPAGPTTAEKPAPPAKPATEPAGAASGAPSVVPSAAPPVAPAIERAQAAVDSPPTDPTACPCEPREASWHFMLPLELGHGFATSSQRDSVAYIFTPRVLPGVRSGVFNLNLVAAVPYRNPGWSFAAGGRAGFVVANFLEGIAGIHFDVEGLYLAAAKNAQVSAGMQLFIGRLIQFGPRFGYDFDFKDYLLETTLSVDFAALDDPVGALIGVGPMRDYRDDTQ